MKNQELMISHGQYQIQVDLYIHEEMNTNTPMIIMAHGLGGEKSFGLNKFAEFYANLGYQVCVFDHSGFGLSSGAVKNLVDKSSQISDWKAVIDYLGSTYHIPKTNMILWGYSFSGAHVLTLASEQKFKAVIANFPHADGLASLTLYPKKYLLPATMLAMQDIVLARFGKVKTMPVVSSDRFAVLAGEDCYKGYLELIPQSLTWDNEVPARIIATVGLYRPTTVVHQITCPVFIAGAEQDSLIPIQATRKLAKKLKYGVYHEYSCGHFGLFHSPIHEQLLNAHQAFLEKNV
jgi:uncharacterized protein